MSIIDMNIVWKHDIFSECDKPLLDIREAAKKSSSLNRRAIKRGEGGG